MKKEKKTIDYIFIRQKWGKRKQVKELYENVSGISVLKLTVTEKKRKDQRENSNKNASEYLQAKLKKIAKRYQIEHCAVGADYAMAERLQMTRALFLARKHELLERRQEVLGEDPGMTTASARRSFLLVLDSEGWSGQEVLQLFLTAKDYYNDLNIVVKRNDINLEQIREFLYDEWGIVLNVLSEHTAMKSKMNYALFLLERWKDTIYGYSINRGYVLLEHERGIIRTRRKGDLNAGFVYECGGLEIPYQMAVDIFYQNPELYDKFTITFIDIYSV